MATGAFFDTKKALLLTPLISSTCSLIYAHDQHVFLHILTHPELADRSNAILPTYWRVLFPRSLPQVVVLLGTTVCSSVAAVRWHGPWLRERGALPWYVATAGLAVAHLVFASLVVPLIKYMMDDEGGRSRERKRAEPGNKNVEAQGKWLGWNLTRMLTTDLGAWVCAAVAVTKVVSVE